MKENINETVRLIKREKHGEDFSKIDKLPEEVKNVYVGKQTSKKNQ